MAVVGLGLISTLLYAADSNDLNRRSSFDIRHSTDLTRHSSFDIRHSAESAWAERTQPGKTEEAIRLWQEALKQDPSQTTLLISLTKAMGRAVRHASSSAERKRWADAAKAAGKTAIEKNPHDPNAWAYYAEALGQWANARKGVSGLKTVKQAVAALEKAIALDPKHAYAHMLLAEFYRQAPAVISIGDKKKALAEARQAVAAGPAMAITHLALARALMDEGQNAEARQELHTILALTPPADAIPETLADQATARELLQQMGDPVTTGACSTQSSSAGASCGQ